MRIDDVLLIDDEVLIEDVLTQLQIDYPTIDKRMFVKDLVEKYKINTGRSCGHKAITNSANGLKARVSTKSTNITPVLQLEGRIAAKPEEGLSRSASPRQRKHYNHHNRRRCRHR
jgi:hypothetical protein